MKTIALVGTFVLLLSNCTIERKIYSPTQVINPSIQKKNDYSIHTGISFPTGADVNGGYAVTKNWAITGGFYAYKNRDREESYNLINGHQDSAILTYHHKGFQIGTGIFLPLIRKPQSPLYTSLFAGYISGEFRMKEEFYNIYPTRSFTPVLYFYNSNIGRWFIQNSMHLYTPNFHQTFSTRINFIEYNKVKTDYSSNQQISYNLPPHAYSPRSTFLDIAFDSKFFFSKKNQIGIQLFGSITTRLNSKDYDFYIQPIRLGIGLVVKSPLKNR